MSLVCWPKITASTCRPLAVKRPSCSPSRDNLKLVCSAFPTVFVLLSELSTSSAQQSRKPCGAIAMPSGMRHLVLLVKVSVRKYPDKSMLAEPKLYNSNQSSYLLVRPGFCKVCLLPAIHSLITTGTGAGLFDAPGVG